MNSLPIATWAGAPVFHYPTLDSTNSEALRRRAELSDRAVFWADEQTAGRGRLGRRWQTQAGGSLCLSVFHRSKLALSALSGLGPALGIAAARALRKHGVEDVMVKWPNDLQVQGSKLGGILVEAAVNAAGGIDLVAGIGINLQLDARPDIDQPWTDLHQLGKPALPAQLAPILTSVFLRTLDIAGSDGLSMVLRDWPTFDALAGRSVRVTGGLRDGGRAIGIADDGRLRLRDEQGEWACHSGEVSVRAESC